VEAVIMIQEDYGRRTTSWK